MTTMPAPNVAPRSPTNLPRNASSFCMSSAMVPPGEREPHGVYFSAGKVRTKYAVLRTLPETMTQPLAGSKTALRAFGEVIAAGADTDAFATAGVHALRTYVGADLTTLSDCDLICGHRRVLDARPTALGRTTIAAF